MIISIVVAIAQNHAIGRNNQLLWRLPADLRHFREVTTGHTVLMGRKTYASVGKPLPNRKNIVISRNRELEIPGVLMAGDLQSALALCGQEEEVFVIGGAEIYQLAMDITDKIYLTVVEAEFDGDTFFPAIDYSNWEQTAVVHHSKDEKHAWDFTFSTLIRKKQPSF